MPEPAPSNADTIAAPAGAAERFLRGVVVAAVVLPLGIFIGASILSYQAHFAGARERLGHSVDVIHAHAARVFESHLLVAGQVDALLQGMADDDIRGQAAALNARFKLISDRLPQIEDIWVLDAHGRPLVTANFMPIPAGLDLSDRDYFRAHREGAVPPGRTYVSEVLRGRANPDTSFFQLSTRRPGLADPQQFNGVTAVSIEPGYFRNFFAQAAGSGFDSVGLVRADGYVLARHGTRPASSDKLPDDSLLLTAIAREPTRGIVEGRSPFDDIARLIAYRRLPDHDVYVTLGIDRDRVLRQWIGAMGSHLVFGVPATVALVMLTLMALQHTRREALALTQLREEVVRREKAEDQLRQAQKMEALGRLTGGVAHDFNNLLTIVIGSLDMLMRRWTAPEPRLARLATNALDGAHRAAALTARLLAFARRQPLDPKAIDVNHLVASTSELFRRTLGESIKIETVLAGGLWQTFADPHQLEAALLNVAVNARDAMTEGGRLTIETANAHLDDAYAATHNDVRAGQYVMVAVTDTGHGMSREVLANAFEPFFTTKPAGQGTGLGLSQVYGFTKQSGGHIKIYSEVGQGTTVKFYLPRHSGTADEAVAAPAALTAAPTTAGTILVVEDEEGVRHFTVDTLREFGYRVVEADGAEPALRLLDAATDVSLMVTDVIMPGLNGRKLADEAVRRRPGLKVLFMTGYTSNAIVHNGMLDPGVALISKPFTTSQLAAKIEQVLK
ncbi:ATP-binding protein [Xanthobacteraceae bacterium Astr-EGSB]|uniref:hybrid sensor histidine kinase/response regulator n=1 Tax=Astrobacterium formosum TaxID=3069710 RepID=UPI0027B77CF5|nr:ATP-binding protein [Xanthobacteraceae bacterium Astr-EGSB]